MHVFRSLHGYWSRVIVPMFTSGGRGVDPGQVYAPPDVFGPYGWEDGVNPGTGLTFTAGFPADLTIVSADAFTGTRAARIQYTLPAGPPAARDCNRNLLIDVSSFNLSHFFVSGYVKLDGASAFYSTSEVVARKLIYLKSDPDVIGWHATMGLWDSRLDIGLIDRTQDPDIFVPLFRDPPYIMPFDVYRGVEWEVQLNDIGQSNGLMRVWVYNPNGTTILAWEVTGVKLRSDVALPTDNLGSVEWGSQVNLVVEADSADEHRWWDQIAISSKRIGPVVGTGASGYTAWGPVGLNYRNTVGYVTDPANTIFATDDIYPVEHSIAKGVGIFMGRDGGGFSASENLSTGVNPRLAGTLYRDHAAGAGQGVIRVDTYAPVGGTYDLRLALGGVGVTNFPYVEARDGSSGPVLFTISDVAGCAAGEFYDANGVKRTSAADWITNNTARSITLTGSQLVLNLKYLSPLSGGRNAISHLEITRTA